MNSAINLISNEDKLSVAKTQKSTQKKIKVKAQM